MADLAHRPFVKMNGLGNEILILDLRGSPAEVSPDAARALARPDVLPFDQAMVLYNPRREGTCAFVRILNNDGSESAACGNGTRCIATYEAEASGSSHMLFESPAGLLDCTVQPDGLVRVDMGAPRLEWQEIPLSHTVADTSAVLMPGFEQLGPAAMASMGNPHATFFVPDANAVDVDRLGAALEAHELFPEKANISFASLIEPDHILLHVWERGAGRTRACGTAACAAGVNGVRTGRTGRQVTVTLPGGDLKIHWRESNGHVEMTGPTEFEFAGKITAGMLNGAA